MSMYRQLWLAIILSTLLALVGSLLASTLTARTYLEEQLRIKNEDNASALALSLSQNAPDNVTVELAVSALFDSGHYASIKVTDPRGKVIVERTTSPESHDAPAWLTHLLPINAPAGQAQISNGWKQFGTISLVSHSRFAYRALWKSVLELIAAMAFSGFFAGYLGSLILRRLKDPLGAVIGQARAISERRFITCPEPSVPELRHLTSAMNTMVKRLKAMFDEEAGRLETLRREANCDTLTGLANRDHFMARLRETMSGEESLGGALILARVANLADINHRLGRSVTDDLLQRFGQTIKQCAEQYTDGLAARLNGADFSILLPGANASKDIATRLLQSLIQECASFVGDGTTAFVSVGAFDRGMDMSTLLSQVDAALAAAESDNANSVRVATLSSDEEAPKSAEEWSDIIRNALAHRWVRLISFPVVDMNHQPLHQECPLRLMFDQNGEWQPAGKFLPLAERLKLTTQLDLAAVSLGLDELAAHPDLPGLAINLSASSLQDDEFRRQLGELLKKQPKSSPRLWLEVAESGAFKHFDAFRAFCLELRDTGCRLGMEHFGRQFSQIGSLHDLGLDYLKVDASFVRGLDANPGNQAFLKGLSSIAHSIGLQVIAEGVVSQDELQSLIAVGFDGATGPAIK